ncbi:hypothetical protein MKX03_029030 [Papaver bracteatum]|nr:hypothetical protein MKX03_029030 [Papaver bracteatum]
MHQYKGYESNNWYLFTTKYQGEDRKDSVGDNKLRDAGQGFWLLTTHCSIYSRNSPNSVIGYKDAWIYYQGRDSEEHDETDYVMHEYTLNHPELDEWILCGIYKKEKMNLIVDEETAIFDNVEKDVETNFSDDEDEFDS